MPGADEPVLLALLVEIGVAVVAREAVGAHSGGVVDNPPLDRVAPEGHPLSEGGRRYQNTDYRAGDGEGINQ